MGVAYENTLNIDQGDVARLTATFTDPDTGFVVDPDEVYFKWVTPGGDTVLMDYGVDIDVVRVSAGVYRCCIPCEEHGRYKVRVWSEGAGQAAELVTITVRKDHTA